MKKAKIYMHGELAGFLAEDDEGYHFAYQKKYVTEGGEPISLTMPLTDKVYHSAMLFPFFDGLIPEGWLLEIAEKSWKINVRDRMSLLLATCRDCIGAVSVEPVDAEENE
ncbi:HipA N-terminal domain-containing protein [Imperialibacter roseus]|uniref:HipA N-terminal domain-containing protein n=1 Tax=Imperialibacter roseus TaxID=1324217 RepID=A0ABZ0IKX9_9BACT|nr:HipA N-terminal domain-containing protein [Imperialibacter roseus]WOK05683.1 HipA N-terminal domain-containing protein [Imperialibacter roseus]